MRLDSGVTAALNNRAWPYCCSLGRRRLLSSSTAGDTFVLDVFWETNALIVCTIQIPWDELHSSLHSESFGTECIIRPFREMLSLPPHFPTFARPFVHPSMLDDYLQEVRGMLYLAIHAWGSYPSARLQTVPPRRGLLHMLHRHIDARVGRFKSLCSGCFRLIGSTPVVACVGCGATTLCPACLLPHRSPMRCIFCVEWTDDDDLTNMLCVKRFWYEAGGLSARDDYFVHDTPAISWMPHDI